ncbi:hypothetical protein ACFLUU_02055 [Chloroflexota bacterium]
MEPKRVKITSRQILTNRAFWIYCAHTTSRSLAKPMLTLHLIPHLTDRGLDPTVAAGILGSAMAMEIPDRLLIGWLADCVRITRLKYLAMLGLLGMSLGVFILLS